MTTQDNTTDATSIPAEAAIKNGTTTAKVTQVRSAQPVPKSMQSKPVEWQPEGGWVSKMADDRFNEVAERARLKGLTLRDVRVTLTVINEDQTEQRLATFAGDTVQGQNNPYTGSTGLGGPVVSPGEAFFAVLRKFHYGSPTKKVYRAEFWDQTNDGRMITSSFIQLAPSAQLDKMEAAVHAARPQPAFESGLGNPSMQSMQQGYVHPTSTMPQMMSPQMMTPQGIDPTVIGLFNQMQEMQRRHYEELRALAEKVGQPPPPPPVGIGFTPPVVESPETIALKKEVELLRAQLPKPKSDIEIMGEKMIAGFAAIMEAKFPTTPGVGVGQVGVGGNAQPSMSSVERKRQALEQMEEELALEERGLSLAERFKKMQAKYGVGQAPEEEPEEPATSVVETKPEEDLPVKQVPVEGLMLFGQPFQRVIHKDENVGFGQVAWDHFMANPGAQEFAFKLAGQFAEKVAEPLVNIMAKLSAVTAPKPNVGVNTGVGYGGYPNSNPGAAQVVDSVPPGAVDAGDGGHGSGNESGGGVI